MTAAIQSRFRSVTTATTPSRRSPRAAQRPRQPVGLRVELPVGPPPVAVHGRDGVRVHPHALLEQLVEPAVRQLSARPGQPVELEAQLLVRQQARPPVLGARVGDHQREGGEVVAGDPLGAARVERVGAVAQVQREPAAGGRERHPEHGVLGEVSADLADGVEAAEAADRVELGLERRPGHAQLTLELVHREVPVLEQVRLDPSGVLQQRPPERAAVVSGRAAAAHRARPRSRSPRPARRTAPPAPSRARPAPPSAAAAPAHRPAGAPPPRGRHRGSRRARRRPVPGRGVHRGIAVAPPASRTARQNSRPVSTRLSIESSLRSTFARCQPPRTSTAARLSSTLIFRTCRSPERSRICLAGFPPHCSFGGTSSPFMRKEPAASTAPSPTVTP